MENDEHIVGIAAADGWLALFHTALPAPQDGGKLVAERVLVWALTSHQRIVGIVGGVAGETLVAEDRDEWDSYTHERDFYSQQSKN